MDDARVSVTRLSDKDELTLSFAPGLGWRPLRHLLGIHAFGMPATISSALAMAPDMPFSAGVSTRSAPKMRSRWRRSTLMLSGMVRISL